MSKQTTYYPSLSGLKQIKNPFRCPPDTNIIIEDIHPADPKYKIKDHIIGKQGKLYYTAEKELYRRQESYSPNDSRKSWVACNIELDGIIYYFTAIRFRRAEMPSSTFYKYVKEGKI